MFKVSVIIPVYNAEQYIEKCLDTVCEQTMSSNEYEIVAIDDGSTDKSIDILQEYAGKYDNLNVICQSNRGAAAARNAGLDRASGEYISFVDSDDWVERNMLEVLYETASENNADMVFFNLYKNEDEKMKPYLRTGVYDEELIKKEIYPRLISTMDSSHCGNTLRGATWCKFFRRSVLEINHIRYNEMLIYNEDLLFSIEATIKSKIYLYLGDSYLYHNRINSNSITKRYIDCLWEKQKSMPEILHYICIDVDYDFIQQINKKMFGIAIYCIENEAKRKNTKKMMEKLSTVRRIIHDNDLKRRIANLSVKKMSNIEKMYFICFKYKLTIGAYLTSKYRYRNNKMF